MTASEAKVDPGSVLARQMDRAAKNRQLLGAQPADTEPQKPRTLKAVPAAPAVPTETPKPRKPRINVTRALKPVRKGIRTALSLSRGDSPWNARPATLEELYQETLKGAWMPGEQHRWLERIGVAYGLVVGIGCSALLYGLAWVLQRPGRATAALAITAVLWVSFRVSLTIQ